jgi:hypothetical protein
VTAADPEPAAGPADGDPVPGALAAADRAGAEVAAADRVGAAELGAVVGCAAPPVDAVADGATRPRFAVPCEPAALAICPPWPKTATAPPTAAITTSTTAPAITPVRKLISSSQALMAARSPECDPNAPFPLTIRTIQRKYDQRAETSVLPVG